MPYNETIEQRIYKVLGQGTGFEKKKMFGGIGYLLNGNMVFGVYKDFLVLRLGERRAAEAIERAHAGPFDVTGPAHEGVGDGG